ISPAGVHDQRVFDQTPAYQQCLKAEMSSYLKSEYPGVAIQQVSVTKVAAALPMAGDEFETVAIFKVAQGFASATERVIHPFPGDVASRVQIGWCSCATFPNPDTIASTAVAREAAHMVAYVAATGQRP